MEHTIQHYPSSSMSPRRRHWIPLWRRLPTTCSRAPMAAAPTQCRSSWTRSSVDIDEQTPGHCVIPDEGGGRILLLAGGDGAWTLPIVRVNEEWGSPNWLGRLHRETKRQLGLHVTVLRHLQAPP